MADVALEGAGFWLPAEFFEDDDVDDVHQNQERLAKPNLGSDFCFPTEFPYDFQTQNRQHVEKAAWVMSTSPQSTLGNWSGGSTGGSSIGSPNGAPPPSTPLSGKTEDAVVDLICKAVGQVAKLKLNSGDGLRTARNLGLVYPPRSPAHIQYSSTRTPSPSIFQPTRAPAPPLTAKQENPGGGMWYGPQQQVYDYRGGKAVGRADQAAWPVKQNPTRDIGSGNRKFLLGGPGCGGGAASKRECAGTGVFLPRAYGSSSCNAYSSECHRKPVYPTSLLQERNVDPLFKNFENMKADLVQSLPRPQPEITRFNGGFVSDYDLLVARRNSIMLQYQKSLVLSEKWATGWENYLFQEWN
ncbi:uncharacterized protein [Henckelia pumila]|uniref:uncharacterized protein n=1 Tax=Henckelia pumila TaxID=405737 RepID=UPI003C6E0031